MAFISFDSKENSSVGINVLIWIVVINYTAFKQYKLHSVTEYTVNASFFTQTQLLSVFCNLTNKTSYRLSTKKKWKFIISKCL